jgi:hypothetical protein
MDNPEPVFTARGVRLMAPPQAVKDKHVRLRVAPALNAAGQAPDFTPRCHPDSAGIRKRSRETWDRADGRAGTPGAPPSWRSSVTFKAMGWGLREQCEQLELLAGDQLDIAYTLGMNDHPDFGGLELTVRDLRDCRREPGAHTVIEVKVKSQKPEVKLKK